MNIPWNTPFNFSGATGAGFGIPANTFTGTAGAASSAAGTTAASGAGAASGGLAGLGGALGPAMIGSAALNFAGGLFASNAAAQSQKAAYNAERVKNALTLGAMEYLEDSNLLRQARAKELDRDMRIAGINRPEYFAAFMQGGMTPSQATRMSYSPIMSV